MEQVKSDKGLPNFINLIGIESPRLTASPAIAEYIKKLI
jgi:L-2-hydroxyglutarate oxidase LhgO